MKTEIELLKEELAKFQELASKTKKLVDLLQGEDYHRATELAEVLSYNNLVINARSL